MTRNQQPVPSHAERLRQLADTRQRILAMPAEKTMAAILDHAQPAALVHSFPETELAFLIHDIGPDEALPIIALASNRQWEYLLDTEAWKRDRIDYAMGTTWLALLLQADPDRLVRWCYEENLDFLELYLFRNIELRIRESDQSPSELGEGFFSDDDTFYVRFVDYPTHTPAEETRKNRRNAMLAELLRRLSQFDHPRFQTLLMETASVIPAEAEEELFRLRNVRLAEKGFLPFHEAIGVYQPLDQSEMARRGKKVLRRTSQEVGQLPVPSLTAAFLTVDNLFVRGLTGIGDPHVLGQLQVELASLCNQVITADQLAVQGRAQLEQIVIKVSGYLSIGLETETADVHGNRETLAADLLQRHLLSDIFRIGIAEVLNLHWRATRWRRQSWFQARKLGLTFWDEAWMGLLGGLLIDRPKRYDPSSTGSNYRDFGSRAEIDAASTALAQMMTLDTVFRSMAIPDRSLVGLPFLTYKSLLLTLWARACRKRTGLDAVTETVAVGLPDFIDFYRGLWTEKKGRRQIDQTRKRQFLDWLADTADMTPADLEAVLGTVFEALFGELERELSAVKTGNIDPRYIQLFLITP